MIGGCCTAWGDAVHGVCMECTRTARIHLATSSPVSVLLPLSHSVVALALHGPETRRVRNHSTSCRLKLHTTWLPVALFPILV